MIGRTVVVGVDGSREATDAAALGRRVARAAGGELHLVGAVQELGMEVAAIRARLPIDRFREELLVRAREKVSRELAREFSPEELGRSLSMGLGRAEHVIALAGGDLRADLFVLGGHRRASPTARLRRSTARHLLRAADRPVLVTGPNGGLIERVVAAVDVSFVSAAVVDLASELATLLGLPLEVVHVVPAPTAPGGVAKPLDPTGIAEDAAAQAERELEALLPAGAGMRILDGDVVPAIQAVVSEDPSTLLVLGAQGRGWVDRLLLGSTTETLLDDLPTSLAILPAPPTSS